MKLARNVTLKQFQSYTVSLHSGLFYEAVNGAKLIAVKRIIQKNRQKIEHSQRKRNYTLSSINNNYSKLRIVSIHSSYTEVSKVATLFDIYETGFAKNYFGVVRGEACLTVDLIKHFRV